MRMRHFLLPSGQAVLLRHPDQIQLLFIEPAFINNSHFLFKHIEVKSALNQEPLKFDVDRTLAAYNSELRRFKLTS